MAELDRTGDDVDVATGPDTGDPSDVAIEATSGKRGIGIGEASLDEEKV